MLDVIRLLAWLPGIRHPFLLLGLSPAFGGGHQSGDEVLLGGPQPDFVGGSPVCPLVIVQLGPRRESLGAALPVAKVLDFI